jgi:hypothetical protein
MDRPGKRRETLDPLLRENDRAVVAVYSQDAMGRIPRKRSIFSGRCFPAGVLLRGVGKRHDELPFAKLCEKLEETALFIEILPAPAPHSAGAAPPPAPQTPSGDPATQAAYQACLTKIATIRDQWPLAAEIRPTPSRARAPSRSR